MSSGIVGMSWKLQGIVQSYRCAFAIVGVSLKYIFYTWCLTHHLFLHISSQLLLDTTKWIAFLPPCPSTLMYCTIIKSDQKLKTLKSRAKINLSLSLVLSNILKISTESLKLHLQFYSLTPEISLPRNSLALLATKSVRWIFISFLSSNFNSVGSPSAC